MSGNTMSFFSRRVARYCASSGRIPSCCMRELTSGAGVVRLIPTAF